MTLTSLRPRFRSDWLQTGLFLSPYLAGTFLLVILPALATLALSFTHYDAFRPPSWTGLDNFRQLWSAPLVRRALYNTLLFLGMAVPLRVLGALALTLLLQHRRRLFGLFRAAVYLPTIIPESAYALLWLWILNPVSGPLNLFLQMLGVPAPAWLTDPAAAHLAIVLMALFQLGEGFVVLLAGRQSIPSTLYEAATVDGAGPWQCFWKITLPLLLPWLLLLTFRDLVVSLQNTFTPSFMLTYGGPDYATTLAPLLVYELAFDLGDFGLASAMLVLIYLLLALLIFGILNLVVGLGGNTDAA